MNHTAASHLPLPQADGLDWLLDDFVCRVAAAHAAVLASSDGLPMATAGLTEEQTATMAAMMSSQVSLAKGVGHIMNAPGGGVRQVVVERDDVCMFVMNVGHDQPPEVSARARADPGMVGCILGVLAATPDCDARVVGYEMAALINSVDEHLVTARRGDVHAGGGR